MLLNVINIFYGRQFNCQSLECLSYKNIVQFFFLLKLKASIKITVISFNVIISILKCFDYDLMIILIVYMTSFEFLVNAMIFMT